MNQRWWCKILILNRKISKSESEVVQNVTIIENLSKNMNIIQDISDNQTTDHGNSVLPVILSFDNEELIEDGWHRFHSYYMKGLKNVPVVVFM